MPHSVVDNRSQKKDPASPTDGAEDPPVINASSSENDGREPVRDDKPKEDPPKEGKPPKEDHLTKILLGVVGTLLVLGFTLLSQHIGAVLTVAMSTNNQVMSLGKDLDAKLERREVLLEAKLKENDRSIETKQLQDLFKSLMKHLTPAQRVQICDDANGLYSSDGYCKFGDGFRFKVRDVP